MEPMFTVRCDPPYEELDGGTGESLSKCTTEELSALVTEQVMENIGRLLPGQVPMFIEVRRLT